MRRGGFAGRGDLLQQFGNGFSIERLAEAEISLRARRRSQTDHDLAGPVQVQPAHRSVHAVHVDDDVVGVGLRQQLPASAETRVGGLECGLECGFGGRIHAGHAEGQGHRRGPRGSEGRV